jgi:hypothetical protein
VKKGGLMRIPYISSHQIETGFEACCAVKVASLLNSELLRNYHYGAADEISTTSFSKLNPRHLQNAREMLLAALAPMTGTTFEIRIMIVPDLLLKAQGDIDMFLLIRCFGKTEAAAREQAAASFLALFPILVTYLPEADLKLVKNVDELEQCWKPFEINNATAVIRRSHDVPLVSVVVPNNVGFLGKDSKRTEREDVVLEHLAKWIPSYDDWGRLLEILTGQMEPTMLLVRLRFCSDLAEERERLNNIVKLCEAALGGIEANEFTLRKTVSMFEEQSLARQESLNHPCFDVAAMITSGRPVQATLAAAFGTAISGRRMGGEEPAWLQGGHEMLTVEGSFMAADYFPEKAPFSIGETACAFRFPSPPSRDIPGLPVQRFRSNLAMLPPNLDESPDSIKLFLNEFQGMSQPVHIDPDDRMRHTYIMGQTGTGKSSLMENMIVQDICAGRGLAVIDPHGEMVDNILARIPIERAEDVIILDLLDRERPVGFNILQWVDIPERDLIIDELYRTLDHIYDMKETGGPIFEQHFRNMMKLLMGDAPRKGFVPTLLEFIRCYSDTGFRHWLMSSINDQQVLDFIKEAEDAGGETRLANIAPYVTSKFGRFVNDTTLRNIVGQEETNIDFDEVMREGKICLIKLGKGCFGSQVSALLANMLVARFKFSAMKRGAMPMNERRDFYIFCDEVQNLPQDNFSELLAEARKYRLGLVLATQYCSQLGNVSGASDDLLSAIFGNVGSLITFRTGSQDAEVLAKGFAPYFNSLDLQSLPNFYGYARMNLKGQSTMPFSFRTELDQAPVNEQLAKRIRSLSRLRYGQDARIVEASIFVRMNSWKDKSREFCRTVMPSYVNFSTLGLDSQVLDLPHGVTKLLKEAELITIGDIVACAKSQLVEENGFSLRQIANLEGSLEEYGCYLQEWEPFSKREGIVDEDIIVSEDDSDPDF